MLKSRRIAVEHVGPVEHPCIQVVRRTVVTIALTDHVVAVRPDGELRIIVRDPELEGVRKKAVRDRVRTFGNRNALHCQRIARVRQVVSKLGDYPTVRQMVVNDIRIAPPADAAVVVRRSARPQCLGIGWTRQPIAVLIKDLESEVHNLNVMIGPYGAVGVWRSVARLVGVEIGRGSCEWRRGTVKDLGGFVYFLSGVPKRIRTT